MDQLPNLIYTTNPNPKRSRKKNNSYTLLFIIIIVTLFITLIIYKYKTKNNNAVNKIIKNIILKLNTTQKFTCYYFIFLKPNYKDEFLIIKTPLIINIIPKIKIIIGIVDL